MSETKQILSDIASGISEKLSSLKEKGKDTLQAMKFERESRENLQAVRSGAIRAQKEKLSAMREEAKVKAMLELQAKQELQKQYIPQPIQQPQQLQRPRRRKDDIFSFTNRPFMEYDPFSGSSPFFPKKRR